MNHPIVHEFDPVVLVGGGKCNPERVQAALSSGYQVVAADGAAGVVLALGHVPDAVIGDMDSLSLQDRAALPASALSPIEEQDSTDFDKCLRHIEAPLVLGHGFLGGRVDHQLAAFSTLVQRPERRCVLVGTHDVVCVLPKRLELDLPIGMRLSLFPMARMSARSTGLRWPIGALDFSPSGTIGTSNAVTGPVVLEADTPDMLLILPVESEEALIRAVAAAPDRWPARAE